MSQVQEAVGGRRLTPAMWLVAAVIAVAGILFGYDQGVISGALRGIDADFDVGTTTTEIYTRKIVGSVRCV